MSVLLHPKRLVPLISPPPCWAGNLTSTQLQATLKRSLITPNKREPKEQNYKFERGTTAFLKEQVILRGELKKYVTIVDISGKAEGTVEGDAMDVDA